jgi:signal peptidase II
LTAIILTLIAGVLVAVDRITKIYVVNNIARGHTVDGLSIGGFELINFTHIHNAGAAFGILQGRQTFLITVTSLFLAFAVAVLYSGKFKSKFMLTAIMLIIAGGVGNLIDRAMQGYVVDFIELGFMEFAIFNFADMCAVVGAFMLFIAVVAEEIRDFKARKACAVEEEASSDGSESDE